MIINSPRTIRKIRWCSEGWFQRESRCQCHRRFSRLVSLWPLLLLCAVSSFQAFPAAVTLAQEVRTEEPRTEARQAGVGQGSNRPNVVLIMADDMGFECVRANGGESYETPHLDQLASSGLRFEHCYSQPLCTPSRVQIMTGIYNSRNYIRFGLLDPNAYTFGNLLRDAGYATCVVGKWQLAGGFEGPGRFGFDEYCLWQLTRRPNRYPNPGLEQNGREVDYKNGEYGPDLVSDYACEFIARHADGDQPFFLYYPMILPHWPFEPTPDSDDWDPAFRRDDPVEKNYGMRDAKHFTDMVRYVDKLVGKIVAKLEETGVRENTIVIFTSDNGTYESVTSRFRGRPWRGGKSYMMDNGTHVPLIVNWPARIRQGRVSHSLVDFSDIMPTLSELTGAELPDALKLDGQSFASVIDGNPGPRESIYCWFFRDGRPIIGGPRHRAGEYARDHRYKLYHHGSMYDVLADFYETRPLDRQTLSEEQRAARERLALVIQRNTREGFYDDHDDHEEPDRRAGPNVVERGEGKLTPFLGPPRFSMQQIFEDERFPNLVIAQDGTLLATWGSQQVRVRRSEDGGENWGAEILVGDGIHGGGALVDEDRGDVLLFTHPEHPERNGEPAPRTLHRSRDHGKSWEKMDATFARDDQDFLPSLHMMGRGLTLVRGPFEGRLIRAARVYRTSPDRYATTIFSDDGGRNWLAGRPMASGTGEAALVQLSDGRLLATARQSFFADDQPMHARRLFVYSDDGGKSWREPFRAVVPDGPRYRGSERRGANYNGHFGMFSGLVRLPVAGRDILLYSNSDHDGHERIRMTVWASFDGGRTWPVKRMVHEGLSAYSSLAAGRPGTATEGWIYLQFEHGEGDRQYAGCQLARFNLAWLLAGEPTGDGEIPAELLGGNGLK